MNTTTPCPYCGSTQDQVKAGRTGAGSQRILCHTCHRRYTPTRKPKGHPAPLRAQAIRHYLARLGRRSRCFRRSLAALRRAVQVWVYAWNRRQLYKRRYPQYPAHVMHFAYPHD